MAEQLQILPVLPGTFDYQNYSQEDNQLISASILILLIWSLKVIQKEFNLLR